MTQWWWLFVTALGLSARKAYCQCIDTPQCFGCGTASVSCSGAGLTVFPYISIADQQLVECLSLSGNELDSLSVSNLENFTALTELDISSNNIQVIGPGTFSQTAQLEEINFESNNLQELPENLFANTPNLQKLDISSNNIQVLEPGTFSQTAQLEEINLERNNLQELPESLFANTPNLQKLNFRFNNIENISSATFAGLASSADIDLTSNPLNCDCGLYWLPGFINSSEYTGALSGTCSSPLSLSGTDINELTESQLICDCSPVCVNGICDASSGHCICSDGYTGDDCSSSCTPGTYGSGCLQNCSCVRENAVSPCGNINGTCYCLPGYTGDSCQDECSTGSFGHDCAGVCLCQNGALCDFVTGVCTCTSGWSGIHCNISSCSDGIRNNNETDIDCGGELCLPCQLEDDGVCRDSDECEEGEVCLGPYTHPSQLLYPFSHENNFLCVDKAVPGEAILQKFKDALLGRNPEETLSDVSPHASISEVESSVQQEVEIQFGIEESLKSVQISDLEQDEGDPLYQTCIQWNEGTPEASIESDMGQMIANMNSGKLKGTLLINKEDKKVILNI